MPPPRRDRTPDDWTPFDNKVQFALADFLFEDIQMLGRKINGLMETWAADNLKHGDLLSLADHAIFMTPLIRFHWEMLHKWRSF